MVVTALLAVVVISTLVLDSGRPSRPGTIGLTITPLSSALTSGTASSSSPPPSSTYYETISGCTEDAYDHNHDVDPRGFIDQEDDECLPAQHAPRLPDGAPANRPAP